MKDPVLEQTIMELSKFSFEQGKMSVSDYRKILEHCGCKDHLTPMSGEQFRWIRTKLRLSQAALASLFGISLASVVKYEAGRRISNPVAILMRTMSTHGIKGLRCT